MYYKCQILWSVETWCYVDEEYKESVQRILSAASQQMLHSRQLQWKGLNVIGILSHCSHALLMQMIQLQMTCLVIGRRWWMQWTNKYLGWWHDKACLQCYTPVWWPAGDSRNSGHALPGAVAEDTPPPGHGNPAPGYAEICAMSSKAMLQSVSLKCTQLNPLLGLPYYHKTTDLTLSVAAV